MNQELLSKLPKTVQKKRRRLGRGHGSGRVKTSGRGTKGQRARGKMPLSFEGGQLSIIKKLPQLRGRTRNKPIQSKPYPMKINLLNTLKDNSIVTIDLLKKENLIGKDIEKVKILGRGRIKVKLSLKVACSKSVRQSIIDAGGKVLI